MSWLARYSETPGRSDSAPVDWPANSQLARHGHLPTLVIFAHPRCPCTRATIGELALIMAACPDKLQAYVLFSKPADAAADWEQTDLWRSAEAIPGVEVMVDPEDVEARRFHASTSGQAMLFDPAGKLLFSGGITKARGHSGDNLGRDAIVERIRGQTMELARTPVFGCPIFHEDNESL